MAKIEYTDEQMAAIDGLVAEAKHGKPVQTLGGFAGTGKSTVLREIANQLGYKPCAFTGKAAHVLRRKGMDAQTIHSLIYTPMKDEETGHVRFDLKSRAELLAEGIKGFLPDEASMVYDVLDEDLRSFGLPIIYVGDHGQLEPVGNNPNIMLNPDFTLETVHRNAGEIARFAEWIRMGYDPGAFESTEGKVDYIKPHQAYKVTSAVLKKADQIICAFNKSRVEKNTRLRQLEGREGDAQVGDRVMCLKNKRQLGIFNGMQGTIAAIDHRARKLDFQTELGLVKDIEYLPKAFDLEKLDEDQQRDERVGFFYCHAVTCHKAQGDEWPHVLVLEQVCQHWDHVRWAYTAASRAREKVTWVAARRRFNAPPKDAYDELP